MDEMEFVKTLQRLARPGKARGLGAGIGDDAAAIEIPGGEYMLVASDTATAGTHFPEKVRSYRKVGMRAACAALSDIAACGGSPEYVLADMALPRAMGHRGRIRLFEGIVEGASSCGARVIGGDTVAGRTLTVSVTAIGRCAKEEFVPRSGAKKSDLIMMTGPVRSGKRSDMDINVRWKEGRELAAGYRINAMIDTSDGIGPDLIRLCRMSGTGCEVWPGSVPLASGVSLEEALYYGESFELLFSLPVGEARRLMVSSCGGGQAPGYFVIGRMRSKDHGCWITYENGREELLFKGYRHF